MLTPNDLYEIRKIVVSAQLITKGDWDAQIQSIEEAASASVQASKDTIAAAEAASVAHIQALQAAADAATQKAADDAAAAQVLKDQLTEQQQATIQATNDAQAKLADLKQAQAEYEEIVIAQSGALDNRKVELDRLDMTLSVKAQKLADAQAALDSKLAQLKSLAN